MSVKIITPENKNTELDISSTHNAKEFLEKELPKFGEIIYAELKHENKLTLKSKTGYEIKFDGPFTAGYVGEGPNGLVSVLEKMGFELRDLIHTSTDFKLEKRQR